jgi:hypothetical protein
MTNHSQAPRRWAALWIVLASVSAAGGAHAADEEIQVYMDEMNRKGGYGLDVHTSYVLRGDRTPGFPGEQQGVRRLRITPEFAYGLTDNLELGGYLPLTTVDHNGKFNISGEKFRLKYIAPKAPGQTWFVGLNFEIGRVQHRLDPNPWNSELKGIWGVRTGRWTVASNLNFDFKVHGPAKSPSTLDVSTKVSYKVDDTLSLGVESYNDLGETRNLGHLRDQSHAIYAVVDKSFGAWDLDLGVGRGDAGAGDKWVIKAIIGVPIGG